MPAGPLEALGAWLQGQPAPPHLGSLVQAMTDPEDVLAFRALLREYLPEWEQNILALRGAEARVVAFAESFEEKYFPLHWVFTNPGAGDEGYSFLVSDIHPQTLGWDDEDWHEIADRPVGFLLIYTLGGRCEAEPGRWDRELHDAWERDLEGQRVTAVAEAAKHVDEALLRRVPEGGYTRPELHRLLDGTDYAAVALAADWFRNDTGNLVMDVPLESEQGVSDPWGPDNVRIITETWAEAKEMVDRVNALGKWLEQDPNRHFSQLLDFIDHQKGVTNRDPRQLWFMEPDPERDWGGPPLGGA